MREYQSKEDLIMAERGLIYVEQPQGLRAYDSIEGMPSKVTADGEKRDRFLMLDAMSLGAIRTVVQALRPENKEKYLSYSWCTIGEWAWEMVGS